MASPNKAWRTMVEESLSKAGVFDIEHSVTSGSHLRYRGWVNAHGNKVPITLIASLTPSDHRAIHKVRADIRRMVNAARSIKA